MSSSDKEIDTLHKHRDTSVQFEQMACGSRSSWDNSNSNAGSFGNHLVIVEKPNEQLQSKKILVGSHKKIKIV